MMKSNRAKSETRKTVGTRGPYATREPGFYTHMFVEDISLGLMGFRHRLEDEGRRVRVEGDDGADDALMHVLQSLADYPSHDVGDLAAAAVESIATQMAWFGTAIYEICQGASGPTLAAVMPYRLYRIPGGFLQVVGKAERRWASSRSLIFLPSESAWVVRLPREIGKARSHRRLLNQLNSVSRPAPEFWVRDLEAGRFSSSDFVFSDYNRSRDAYVARLTRRWGWNRRDSSGTYTTEFFYFYRTLRFRRAQALLRQHIVDELNRLCVRLHIKTSIRLEGFHAPTEIDDTIERTLSGALHYADALRQTT